MGQLLGDGFIVVEVFEIFRGGDDEHELVPAAIRSGGELFKIGLALSVVG